MEAKEKKNEEIILRAKSAYYNFKRRLEDPKHFSEIELKTAEKWLKRLKRYIDNPERCSTEEVLESICGGKDSNFFSSMFTVCYKVSKRTNDECSVHGLYYPYKEHSLNCDRSSSLARHLRVIGKCNRIDRIFSEEEYKAAVRKNEEGLCFAHDPSRLLWSLNYGTQLTEGIIDPLILPKLYKIHTREATMPSYEYRLSEVYVGKVRPLRPGDLSLFFLLVPDLCVFKDIRGRSAWEQLCDRFTYNCRFYNDMRETLSCFDHIAIHFDKIFEKYGEDEFDERFKDWIRKEYPPNEELFDFVRIIDRERVYLGIDESVEESKKKLLNWNIETPAPF